MKDRVRVGDHQGRAVQPAPFVAPQPEPPPMKHCWVTDRHGRLPALLIGWRQVEGSWSGRVVHAVLDPDDNWIVVEEWLRPGTPEAVPRGKVAASACPAETGAAGAGWAQIAAERTEHAQLTAVESVSVPRAAF